MKDYNLFALRGDPNTSDLEVCHTLGLPVELAGTPEINKAAMEKMYKENINGYIKQGIPMSKAIALASEARAKVAREIESLSK